MRTIQSCTMVNRCFILNSQSNHIFYLIKEKITGFQFLRLQLKSWLNFNFILFITCQYVDILRSFVHSFILLDSLVLNPESQLNSLSFGWFLMVLVILIIISLRKGCFKGFCEISCMIWKCLINTGSLSIVVVEFTYCLCFVSWSLMIELSGGCYIRSAVRMA